MSLLDSFSPFKLYVRTVDGCSLYAAWRLGELAIFEDEDGEWMPAHIPSGSVLPTKFMRAIDAAAFINELLPLRNDWVDVRHEDFLRLIPDMDAIADRHHGGAWTPRMPEQPYNPCSMNGYGGAHVA